MVIIKVEVDVAMVVIITVVMAADEAFIKAIIIANITNITHMMYGGEIGPTMCTLWWFQSLP